MQSVRDVLRQRGYYAQLASSGDDAIRAGCAEAKENHKTVEAVEIDAIRAGCAEAKQMCAFFGARQ